MKSQVNLSIPAKKALRKLGQDIRDARRRRRIPIRLMAERAGVSQATISKIEKGDSTTSIGAYSAVLFVLGMIERLGDVVNASCDLTGRRLEDEKLPQRIRLPGNKTQQKSNSGHHE